MSGYPPGHVLFSSGTWHLSILSMTSLKAALPAPLFLPCGHTVSYKPLGAILKYGTESLDPIASADWMSVWLSGGMSVTKNSAFSVQSLLTVRILISITLWGSHVTVWYIGVIIALNMSSVFPRFSNVDLRTSEHSLCAIFLHGESSLHLSAICSFICVKWRKECGTG